MLPAPSRLLPFVSLAACVLLPFAAKAADAPGNAERGAYVMSLAGCASCHTDTKNKGAPLAGGLALKSPYGTFYVPNITPDRATGIGGWSTEDFVRAVHDGKPPKGLPYYPAFPYTSYVKMTRQDVIDLKAYLDTVPAVRHEVPRHELHFPYNLRVAMIPWRWLFFDTKPIKHEPAKSAAWNRGAYIVNGPGHCGECHSPRNFFGAVVEDQAFAGTDAGPDGKRIPNITQNVKRGIGSWSRTDIAYMLQTGLKPDGDAVGGAMGEVVENASHWTEADREAVAEYLKSLPAR